MRLDKARGRVLTCRALAMCLQIENFFIYLTCENPGKENDFILYQKISNGRNTAFGVV